MTSNLKNAVFIAMFPLFFTGCATLPTETVDLTYEEVTLKDVCARYDISWQWDSLSRVVTLRYADKKAKLLVGSDIVLIADRKITLSAPVKTARSSVIVPPDFKPKVIDRLRARGQLWEDYSIKKVREIIIDAGHGGKDPGAIGRNGLYEKKVVLDISKRLRNILRKQGVKVKMVRNHDKFLSLEERTEIVSRSNADLFVSIHANANRVRGIHGIEVYASKDLGPKELSEDQRKKNQGLLFNRLKMDKKNKDLQNIVSDLLYTHKQADSAVLGIQVARKTARYIKTKNGGFLKARFFVLRNTLIPAILVEVGYLSNPKEERLLKKSSYREKIAHGLAKSLIDYINAK